VAFLCGLLCAHWLLSTPCRSGEGSQGITPRHHQHSRAMDQGGGCCVSPQQQSHTSQGPRWATWAAAIRQPGVRHLGPIGLCSAMPHVYLFHSPVCRTKEQCAVSEIACYCPTSLLLQSSHLELHNQNALPSQLQHLMHFIILLRLINTALHHAALPKSNLLSQVSQDTVYNLKCRHLTCV
jgi:hypothetical protein